MLAISIPNTTGLSRFPRAGLAEVWYTPWTYPGTIDPAPSPIFDQAHLSKPVSSRGFALWAHSFGLLGAVAGGDGFHKLVAEATFRGIPVAAASNYNGATQIAIRPRPGTFSHPSTLNHQR